MVFHILILTSSLPIEWSTIALDEAQNIKNAETKQSRAIRKLNWPASYCTNGYVQWKIDFLNYGLFLISSTTDTSVCSDNFKKDIIAPIEKDGSEQKIMNYRG